MKLNGFDPLLFLEINNFKKSDKEKVSQRLLDKISQYIAVRICEIMDLKTIDSPEKLFSQAKIKIPNLDSEIKVFLKDFKKEFNKNLNSI